MYNYGWEQSYQPPEGQNQVERRWKKLLKRGELEPVVVAGRTIANTFWGAAWCTNLESYSDFANRLPRGRTYVRHRAVQHLEIAAGRVQALVRGTWLYEVSIAIAPIPKVRWSAICRDSVGAIDSLIELLQGRFSSGVMERICRRNGGLFPAPSEIKLECSCPDWAHLCKHVAAVLYGVGVRLDERPELLFRLRQVDEQDLIAKAGGGVRLAATRPGEREAALRRRPVGAVRVADGGAGEAGPERGGEESTAARPPAQQREIEQQGAEHGSNPYRRPQEGAAQDGPPQTVIASRSRPEHDCHQP